MTSIVLGSVGQSVGGAVGGPIGAALGGALGRFAGGMIDNQIFAQNIQLKPRLGTRLTDLAVQSSAYGEMIPIVFGNVRIAGNMIWSLPIKETATTTTSTAETGGKGGGSGTVTQSSTVFTYSVTLAIAICEGPIDELVRVWADAKILNPNDGIFRLYKGDEAQMPDPLIESLEGVGQTPAYRGLAYIVMEDIPLADFGNRIPNFTFEVRKSALTSDPEDPAVEELVTAMVMIPGAGEFVYDDTVQSKVPGQIVDSTWIQQGNKTRINQNNRDGKADGLVALDQLEAVCPNLAWVAVVACWFGDSLDAGTCTILPGVEYQTGAVTEPDQWEVAGYGRATARQITLVGDAPRYGGTPSDASLLRYIQEIKSRGYNVMFYPMFFMDVEDKPWRGRVTGTAAEVADFFTKTNGYNDFINHYANLVKDDVDAFVIGSELVGLTSVQDVDDSFPAVDALVDLAATVKAIVGDVQVTYAADWSEYHHTAGGWYHLDPLWASDDIDFVGIDAYFPLTDEVEPLTGFSQEQLQDGWTSGEGYEWIYTDEARTVQEALDPEYAWKNIGWWWNNTHTNPDMSTTDWVPQSKKIWFTEFGFPSVDGASNQPNVFYDPDSSESAFPHHSRGRVDFQAQRNAIKATLNEWAGSDMVERLFLWTWDARPFPFWPDMTRIWADGGAWRTGHWVNGKFGLSSLAAIVSYLSQRVGLTASQIDVSRLHSLVDGYVLNNQASARNAIDNLRAAYFFDAVESDGLVKYVARGGISDVAIAEEDLLPNRKNGQYTLLKMERKQELELPQKVDVLYLNKGADYQPGNQHSQRYTTQSVGVESIMLPVVMNDQVAKNIADISLYNNWLQRTMYVFDLPVSYAALEPTDVISVTVGAATHTIRITETQFGHPGIMKLEGVAEDVTTYDFHNEPGTTLPGGGVISDPGETVLEILDIPSLPGDAESSGYVRYAGCGTVEAWRGAVLFRSQDGGVSYEEIASLSGAVMGYAVMALASGPTDIFDGENTVTVNITGSGELEGMSELAILNGANAAVLGEEIIQFKTATLVSEGQYVLSGLLRGRLGTEYAVAGHSAGERFVLLDSRVVRQAQANGWIGIARMYKGVSVGHTLSQTEAESFTYQGRGLKPFAPVHVRGVRDGSDNLTISWVRRARVNGGWQDFVEVPLDEAVEGYEVDIMDGAEVVRTITGLSVPSAEYSAAEQVADFGSVQGSVGVRVYQMSAVVGRGRGAVVSV